jgi:alpha 1,2-mannosyltransferase
VVEDPIARMDASGALYGYALRMKEKMDTIPSLWATAEAYALSKDRKAKVREQWDVTIPGHVLEVGCHYWNNMEITRLDWFRGPVYQDFFKHLDASGGFFYERWGDAPIRSLAMLLLADKTDVVWFEEMGYQHPWWIKCPPASGTCWKKGVALKPGLNEGCIPDQEIQPHTYTDGAMCNIGQ